MTSQCKWSIALSSPDFARQMRRVVCDQELARGVLMDQKYSHRKRLISVTFDSRTYLFVIPSVSKLNLFMFQPRQCVFGFETYRGKRKELAGREFSRVCQIKIPACNDKVSNLDPRALFQGKAPWGRGCKVSNPRDLS